MIKSIYIGFLVLFTTITFAQNKSDIDSLFQVKDFLLDIRSTVNEVWKKDITSTNK